MRIAVAALENAPASDTLASYFMHTSVYIHTQPMAASHDIPRVHATLSYSYTHPRQHLTTYEERSFWGNSIIWALLPWRVPTALTSS
jgi:hypothetical protein